MVNGTASEKLTIWIHRMPIPRTRDVLVAEFLVFPSNGMWLRPLVVHEGDGMLEDDAVRRAANRLHAPRILEMAGTRFLRLPCRAGVFTSDLRDGGTQDGFGLPVDEIAYRPVWGVEHPVDDVREDLDGDFGAELDTGDELSLLPSNRHLLSSLTGSRTTSSPYRRLRLAARRSSTDR